MGREARDMSEDGAAPGRLSLRQIDRLLLGQLPAAEAEALRKRLAEDPSAQAYLERQESLGSTRTLEDFRAELSRRSAGGQGSGLFAKVVARAAAWVGLDADGPHHASPSHPSRQVLAYGGFAAFACLVLGLTVWTGRLPGPAHDQVADLRPKGPGASGVLQGFQEAEFLLRYGGRDYAPGDLVPARAGDTLALSYRSGDSLQVQIWYQEDEGTPAPFSETLGFALAPSPSWTEAPRRILLEGRWTRQRIWLVISDRALEREAAAESVRASMRASEKSSKPTGSDTAPRAGRSPKVLAFRLVPQV